MTGIEFKAAIEAMGKTQCQFAWDYGVDDRTVRRWIAKKPPQMVANHAIALLKAAHKYSEWENAKA